MAKPETKASDAPLQIVEGVDFRPAPMFGRLLAYFMDLTASGAIALALHRYFGTWLLNAMGNDSYVGMTLNTSLWFMTILGYWVIIPAVMGATPAKRLFQFRIISESPGPVTLVQILQREILGHAASILTVGLGFLLLSNRDEQNRALNDRLSGTRLIQFKSPRPELYKVQDLHADTTDGVWLTYEVGEGSGTVNVPGTKSAVPSHPVAPGTTVEGVSREGDSAAAMPASEVEETAAAPAAQGIDETRAVSAPPGSEETAAAPAAPVVPPAPPPKSGSLYARPAAETAFERRQRAAQGPTVQDLAEALRRTAELVRQGQLMEKVLDRKREDFLAQMERIDLSVSPAEAVRIIIELGREGVLTRDELIAARDILQKRLKESSAE